MSRRFRVMVVDDNPIVRSGLVALLEATDDIDVVGEAGDGRQAVELADRVVPDVVLLDIRMPGVGGIVAAEALSRTARVIMLTHVDDPETVLAAIRNGAVGYLVHNSFTMDELYSAIRRTVLERAHPLSDTAVEALVDAARSGSPAPIDGDPEARRSGFGLSAREAEVMDLLVQGHTNQAVAELLFLTEKTVKNHLNRIYAKLGVRNRATAIVTWLGVPPPLNG